MTKKKAEETKPSPLSSLQTTFNAMLKARALELKAKWLEEHEEEYTEAKAHLIEAREELESVANDFGKNDDLDTLETYLSDAQDALHEVERMDREMDAPLRALAQLRYEEE